MKLSIMTSLFFQNNNFIFIIIINASARAISHMIVVIKVSFIFFPMCTIHCLKFIRLCPSLVTFIKPNADSNHSTHGTTETENKILYQIRSESQLKEKPVEREEITENRINLYLYRKIINSFKMKGNFSK
jgi:hypothetical protein